MRGKNLNAGKKLDKERLVDTGIYLMHLIGSILNDMPVPEAPKEISWELLYGLALRGAVSSISFYGIERLKAKPDAALYSRWETKRELAIYRKVYFDIERERILSELQSKGISCLPLKGILFSDYYPEPGMREMVDNDILYGFIEKNRSGKGYQIAGCNETERTESIRKAKEILDGVMEGLGYAQDEEVSGYHDGYIKKPFLNFEMHRDLVSEKVVSFPYYKEPWRLAVRDPNNPGLFYMKDEDEYLFLISHEYNNHYVRGDSKLRFLADLYVYLELNKKFRTMDWEYICRELEVLGISKFEKEFREMSYAVLRGKTLVLEQRELLEFILDSGADSVNEEIDKGIRAKLLLEKAGCRKKAKTAYIWKRIYLSADECKVYYPFFYKHRCLMPVLIVYRFCKGVFFKRNRLAREIRALWRM